MRGARLYGPADIRFEEVPHPGKPGPGQVLLRSKSVGICGSDLHTYQDGRIGATELKSPLVLGHEFAGIVEEVGPDPFDGNHRLLRPGMHVAVDPAHHCGYCEQCQAGHPNLCEHIQFCGLWPDDGALREYMIIPANTCFPIAHDIDFAIGALLETLGVAVHSVDLARIRVGDTVAILGAGPIGNAILQVVRLTGASRIFVSDKFDWRLDLAARCGAQTINCDRVDTVQHITRATDGRGVDVAIEAAWADHSVQQSVDIARSGGRLVLVGIPGNDELKLKHSVARRKGLTIRMARRMKLVYPRVIDMHRRGVVDLKSQITHRFPLERADEAFATNLRYPPGLMKVIIDV